MRLNAFTFLNRIDYQIHDKQIGLIFNLTSSPIAWAFLFSDKYKSLRNRNTYDSHAHPEISAHELETAVEVNERSDGTSLGFSTDMILERITANLKPLHNQICALTQMMGSLVQGNLARDLTTPSAREASLASESPLTDGPGISTTPPIARQG